MNQWLVLFALPAYANAGAQKDLFWDGASDGSAPLPGRAQPVSGLLAPQPAISPAQQKWMDALGVISAGLSDAGAWLQHQPQAAYHVAALARRHAGLETPPDISAIRARLPAMITTALLLNAARQRQAPQPANGARPQPEPVGESRPPE